MDGSLTVADTAPLIGHPLTACTQCWSCVRRCPVGAIQMVDGRAEVVRERCVACGECVSACSAGGHAVRDDRPVVRELLRSGRPVIALLAGEWPAALHPMSATEVEHALERLGFWAVETTLLGEEIVAGTYEQLHAREDNLLSIRSTCPVSVSFVRTFYPQLVAALAPIVPPYIAQARLVRSVYAPGAAIVYVSPCYARKDEFRDPQFDGAVDAVLDFLELKELMREDPPGPRRPPQHPAPRTDVLKQVSIADGFPRQTLTSRDLTDRSVGIVRGLGDLDLLLRAIVAGEAAPAIIDMLACEACIDGPAVSPGLSGFVRRTIDSRARCRPEVSRVSTRSLLGVLPSVTTVRSFTATPLERREVDPSEIDRILAEGRISRDTAQDCGTCGFPTCVEHAAAISRAESSWELCLPLQRDVRAEREAQLAEHRKRIDAQGRSLAALQALDESTGLWNRRAYVQRLGVEVARHQRYGLPLTVMMVAIDAQGDALPDGPTDGEEVLAFAASQLSRTLRSTDLAARWGDRQLAVILPGITKTQGFAVAEKVRAALSTSIAPAAPGYRPHVRITASFGVAWASPSARTVRDLHLAADTALHAAMSAGGDRVQLAPG